MRSLAKMPIGVVVDSVYQTFRGGGYILLMLVDSAWEMVYDCYASCGDENVELEKLVVKATGTAVAKMACVTTLPETEWALGEGPHYASKRSYPAYSFSSQPSLNSTHDLFLRHRRAATISNRERQSISCAFPSARSKSVKTICRILTRGSYDSVVIDVNAAYPPRIQ
jgi:hypothetical protein